MKPQKNALDFYLLASPIRQSGHQRSRWTEMTVTACHPWASRPSMPSHHPLNPLEVCSTEEGWVWLLQLVQYHCHIFVRRDKSLCNKNCTQVLKPTSCHPSNGENTSMLQQFGLYLLEWLDSSQWDNAHSPDILISFPLLNQALVKEHTSDSFLTFLGSRWGWSIVSPCREEPKTKYWLSTSFIF